MNKQREHLLNLFPEQQWPKFKSYTWQLTREIPGFELL